MIFLERCLTAERAEENV